ncbi:hypothetical protein EV07_1235 [Prochlorococcus sp. MIT 0603]|nr:hypothetical protein EV07_1235 [Prochlorococcus sp. MIT 0603]
MNKDHKDSLVKYACHYGGIPNPKDPEMVEINNKNMKLKVSGEIIVIPFDHCLQDSSDAHKTLVSMIQAIPN